MKKILLFLLIVSILSACSVSDDDVNKTKLIDSSERVRIEEIIQRHLNEKPEVIGQALIDYEKGLQQRHKQEVTLAIKQNRDKIFNNPNDYSIGPNDAPVTLVQFFDYSCLFCRALSTIIVNLPDLYENKLRVVFKEHPSVSKYSRPVALAALAAGRQGKYIDMYKALMSAVSSVEQEFIAENSQEDVSSSADYFLNYNVIFEPDIVEIAKQIGLDMSQWMDDREDESLSAQLDEVSSLLKSLSLDRYKPPIFIIGDNKVIVEEDPDIYELMNLIDAEMQKKLAQ